MIEDIKEIVSGLGGIRPMARKLGHKNQSHVQGWVNRGRIPATHWPDVIKALAKEGVTITDTELRAIYTK